MKPEASLEHTIDALKHSVTAYQPHHALKQFIRQRRSHLAEVLLSLHYGQEARNIMTVWRIGYHTDVRADIEVMDADDHEPLQSI